MNTDLIRAAREGDLKAWENLIRTLYPQALKHARNLLRDKDLAQDAVQNTMLKVFNNLAALKDDGAFGSWWRRILTNEIYLLLRFCTRELPWMEAEPAAGGWPPVEDTVTLKLEMGQAIKRLCLEQQQIFLEIDVRGLSLKEAAQAYGLPLGTVKSRLFRARNRLQEELGQYMHKAKEWEDMTIERSDLTDRIYDYLEGTMDAAAKGKFEHELAQNPDWQQEVKKQKDFLTLLHSLTGKITLNAAEIRAKVEEVTAKIEDYEEVVDFTSYERGKPETLTSRNWFRKPGYYRSEADSASTGPLTIILKDGYMLSWIPAQNQARKVVLGEGYREQMHFSFPESLKAMAENKSSRILGTEYLHGRPVIHMQFSEKIPGLGDMNTHHWMDKETWIPVLTEYYNVKGELVSRREVRELRLNRGLPDSLFELDLPAEVNIEEEHNQVLSLPRDTTPAEAAKQFGTIPYVLTDPQYKARHQLVEVQDGKGVLISMYTVPGEVNPKIIVTQGMAPHTNPPAHTNAEFVEVMFDGRNVQGVFLKFDLAGVQDMLEWHENGFYYSCGGQLERDELLKIPQQLTQAAVGDAE